MSADSIARYAPDHAELTSSDGTRIRCASADIAMAADGTTMVRGSCAAGEDGGNCSKAARTSLTKTLVALTDLPRQSMKFLENMDQVNIQLMSAESHHLHRVSHYLVVCEKPRTQKYKSSVNNRICVLMSHVL